MPGIPPWIRNARGDWFLNMGLLFGRDTHWFASFSLKRILRALKIPIRRNTSKLVLRQDAYRPRNWPNPNGLVVLHMSKLRPGRAPPLSRGRWCAPGRRLSSAGTCRSPAASPYGPAGTTHRRGALSRDVIEGSPHSPITPGQLAVAPKPEGHPASRRSSPRPRPPDGTTAASASTSGFAPRSYPRRTPRRRQAIAHWPGYYATGLSRASNGASHLNSCTLTSHIIPSGRHAQKRKRQCLSPSTGLLP